VNVSYLEWAATLVGMVLVLALDLLIVSRRPHVPKLRECALWVGLYVALAVGFGLLIFARDGSRYAGEFFTGWLTEYSLSVDNLFVFVVILSRFRVPRALQQKALMIGIVTALVMRGGFIAAGAAVIDRFEWILYLFGAFLVYTGVMLARQGELVESETAEYKENPLVRLSRRVLPISGGYHGARLTVSQGGRRLVTPLLIVMIALGTTDLIFAFDSIPAIFGLTKEAYLVFTANVFALMGLRQLYFLIGDLLHRLVYLSYGLAVVLGFIGLKMILQTLNENRLPFINDGQPVGWAPHIPIWLSLVVIVVTLTVAAVASLLTSRHRAAAAGQR
jgi:tellurite resistance protein TerC